MSEQITPPNSPARPVPNAPKKVKPVIIRKLFVKPSKSKSKKLF